MRNDNQETKMLMQGLFVWIISVLLVFAAWLICALLVFFSLYAFTNLSNPANFFIAAIISAILVGTITYRYFKIF